MSLFDRFRPQWKHPDPAIRSGAVAQLEDQILLESIATTDPDDRVRAAAIQALTDKAVLARLARSAGSAAVRELAVERVEDRALLLRIASTDTSATVRARARAKCLGASSVSAYMREILSKLQVAEAAKESAAEFRGTLDEVCQALSRDPRFFINGDVASDSEDSDKAQLRDATQPSWVTAPPPFKRSYVRLVAQTRQPAGDAPAAAGLTYFFHVKVWRTAEDRFELSAEKKQFFSIHDAVAWSHASSGGRDTKPATRLDSPSAEASAP